MSKPILMVGQVWKLDKGTVILPESDNCLCGEIFRIAEKTEGGPWWLECITCGHNKKLLERDIYKHFECVAA